MATYYTIHCFKAYTEEEVLGSYDLYPTFEMACDAIEEHIRRHIESWNDRHPDEQDEGDMPDRKEMFASFVGNYLHYYEAQSERLFVICKRKVVEQKKPIGKCWYCGDEGQELVKDGMCMLCAMK